MRIAVHKEFIGDLEFKFVADIEYDGYALDTKVTVNDNTLCWITWGDKEIFIDQLKNTINEFRI